eukprot:PLAT4248.1.p3 GENE.PLAT4248.1~~PLAT4248.1.p3  ORF type:complete len:162 (+),score=57.58 PLAT4248.1:166-651(+)
MSMINKPSIVEARGFRFVISDSPREENVAAYVDEFVKAGVTDVVRACGEELYDSATFTTAGVATHAMPFEDGDPPPEEVITDWLALVKEKKSTGSAVAVHCVAGLGRAPVLVSLALVEDGMEALDAVELIRSRRRGAINARQLAYLEAYKPRRASGCCVLL